jgi:hypothetical protein
MAGMTKPGALAGAAGRESLSKLVGEQQDSFSDWAPQFSLTWRCRHVAITLGHTSLSSDLANLGVQHACNPSFPAWATPNPRLVRGRHD